jgi:16S rRNA (uracil1498-N3)-methyltransferase
MTVPRFFLSQGSINTRDGIVEISKPDLINQIRRVLRLKLGDPIVALDGEGAVHQCCLTELLQDRVQAKIVHTGNSNVQIRPQITICQALIRGGRFDWVVQKLTELGVSCIRPLICERNVAKYSGNKLEHWYSILREAAEQCERVSIPHIVEPMTIAEIKMRCLTTDDFAGAMKLICLERSEEDIDTLVETLLPYSATKLPPDQIALMIGPEGGFTQSEVCCARDAGFTPVSLGPRILRSETAAIAAMAVLISLTERATSHTP